MAVYGLREKPPIQDIVGIKEKYPGWTMGKELKMTRFIVAQVTLKI